MTKIKQRVRVVHLLSTRVYLENVKNKHLRVSLGETDFGNSGTRGASALCSSSR